MVVATQIRPHQTPTSTRPLSGYYSVPEEVAALVKAVSKLGVRVGIVCSSGHVTFAGTDSASETATAAGQPQPLVREFRTLSTRWRRDTDHLSSPSRIIMHPDYQRIISFGERVLPLILEDLRDRGGEWYWALRIIAGESPVTAPAAGNRRFLDEAWLSWGRRKGYIN